MTPIHGPFLRLSADSRQAAAPDLVEQHGRFHIAQAILRYFAKLAGQQEPVDVQPGDAVAFG